MSIVVTLVNRPETAKPDKRRLPARVPRSTVDRKSRAAAAARTATRRVAVITGTRAEYGLLRSTMQSLRAHHHTALQLVATGMHLLDKFGRTIEHIEQDEWAIDAVVPMQAGDDDALDQAHGLARGVAGIAEFVSKNQTDIVLVLGDRIEAMAGALAGVTTGKLVAHIHGGDVATGDIDDSLRHSITKLAHLHFAATQQSRRRIIRMGESPERVHFVGAPGLDELAALTREYPKTKPRSGWALVVFHPSGRPAEQEHSVMAAMLCAVREVGLRRLIIYPNSDRGHKGVVQAIEEHQASCPPGEVEVARSLDRETYLSRLIESDVIIGNSSSGVIEAGSAGTPAVNVGSRQEGRQRSGRSVIDALESPASIENALAQALRLRPIMGAHTAYGDGRAGERIADLLAHVPLDDAFRRKQITY